MGTSQSKPNVEQEQQVTEKKADDVDCDEQSKRLDLAKKQMGTVQSKPKALDLTPENSISIGPDQKLYIHCHQWESGQKFLTIYTKKSWWPAPNYLPSILVPHGAYKFVAKMDEVIRQLPMEEPQHKEGDESPLILATPCQIVAGTGHYNFELSAWHKKGGKWNFEIRSVKVSEEHTEQWLYIPFSALPELRQEIVDILEEHDGSQRIDEIPTIPEWATQANAPTL